MRKIFNTRTGRAVLVWGAAVGVSCSLAMPEALGQRLAAGNEDTAVIDAAGRLWAWGSNAEGQLGTGGEGGESVPVQVDEAAVWVEVAAGAAHKIALRADGSLWSWGNNAHGQLGRQASESEPLPGRIGVDTHWMAVAAGAFHSLALDVDGNLWAWGGNGSGQLGNNSRVDRAVPVKLNAGPFREIAAGAAHSVAIGSDGSLWSWGDNATGQLGRETAGNGALTPGRTGSSADWIQIAAGRQFTLGIRADGSLWSWGGNIRGQLGHGTFGLGVSVPTRVGVSTDWKRVAAGDLHAVALRADGTLWSWGHGFQGQLGFGNQADVYRPHPIGTATDWVEIAAGALHTVALKSDGVLWSTGLNASGQLGGGTTETSYGLTPSFFGVPDLTLTSLQPLEEPGPGRTFTVNVFAENVGSGRVDAAAPIGIEVRLSEVPQWNHATNIALDHRHIFREIDLEEAFEIDFLPTLPERLESGHYYFGARINGDGGVPESDPENNIVWTEAPLPFLADLTVGPPEVAVQELRPGDRVNGRVPVRNVGDGDLSAGRAVTLEVRLSQGRIWENGDDLILVASHSLADDLLAGETQWIELGPTAAIPPYSPQGEYFVGAWIDPADEIEEAEETDNRQWSASAAIRVNRITLGEAVNGDDLTWTTGGEAAWFGQEEEHSAASSSSAQSPPLPEGGTAWFETEVAGPAYVRFNWKSDTESRDTYLTVTLDGVEQARITGSIDWRETGFLVSAPLGRLRFTYVHGAPNDGADTAWVADLRIEPVTGPDLTVTGIEYSPGNYILQSAADGAALTIKALGKNQGLATELPEDFTMEVRLAKPSEEAGETIVLGQLTKLTGLDADNRFVYQATLALPDWLSAGAYRVGVFADILGDEFDGTNNGLWSETADLIIEHRPDLRAANLAYDPGIFTVRPVEGGGADEMRIAFDLVNSGLADASGEPFVVRLYLSPTRILDGESESLLAEFEATDGLHAQQVRPWTIVTPIPEGTETGLFQYLIVSVDALGEVAESNESNNTTVSDLADIFVQDLPIGVAVGRPEVPWTTGDSRENAPWYGQRQVFFDGREPAGAARAAKRLRQGEASHMEALVTVQGPSPLSFFWKVDSDELYELGVLRAHNYLSFSIDGQEMARISGNVDWHRKSFLLPQAGTYLLRWSYVKELDSSGGADTGWVDQIHYLVPDLVLEEVVALSDKGLSGPYQPGETFRYAVTLRNDGPLAVPSTPSYFVQVRLSPEQNTAANLDWRTSRADQITLDTFELTSAEQRALEPGERLVIEREVVIPSELTGDATFFLGAWVDYTHRLVEGNLGNNLWWTETRSTKLLAPLGLAEAVDFTPTHPDGWVIGGNASWFGQGDLFDRGLDATVPGNASAGQSPIIGPHEEAWFTTEVEGPAIMDFSWKISSRESFNYLRLHVSGGEPIAEIHGERDWIRESVFIPAGPQTIRWVYEKTAAAGEEDLDTAWVDGIRFTPVTQPDLRITAVDFDPGTYVLERDPLPLTVRVENRGAEFPESLSWQPSDLQVVLSKNRVAGDADDYTLGHFARVEEFARDDRFTTGARLVFSGDVSLGSALPEGDYFLIARFDPFEKAEEFDTANNLWIAEANAIRIRRLPNLVPDRFVFDPGKAFFPESPLSLEWTLRNIGLGEVTGERAHVQEIRLMALDRDVPDLENAIFVRSLARFPVRAFLPGRSNRHPNGSGMRILEPVLLPSAARILEGLGEVDPGLEEGDLEVVSKWPLIESDYIYYPAIAVDVENDIEQSSDLRIFHFSGHAFTIHSPDRMPESYEDWKDLYAPGVDEETGLIAYALHLNPSSGRRPGLPDRAGRTIVAGREYFRMTFDVVTTADDLRYSVEVSDDLAHWIPLQILEPPYTDLDGAGSLTGVGGLLDQPLVTAVSDQGYTATVTVRDRIPMEETGNGRFFRLRIEKTD